MRLRKLPG